MRYIPNSLIFILIIAFAISCKDKGPQKVTPNKSASYKRFNGNYNKTFNDMPDLHNEAAKTNGIGPFQSRGDTTKYEKKLTKIEKETKLYRVDKLTHSIPFLVPKAADLLTEICTNFRDSLVNKDMPLYKPIVTSITRTKDDIKSLSRRNVNASENSVHQFATTFDIAWTRFDKVDKKDERTRDDGQLKAVLGQVLHDLRQDGRCYIKHERKQSCFHITVR